MKPRSPFTICIRGRQVVMGRRTIVVGILNVTPDSFSDGGLYVDAGRAVQQALKMATQGADWIDVGGESTRPGASPVDAREELRRILPVIRSIRQKGPALPISVDTSKGVVAEEALRAGADIVNDVSGLRFDPGVGEAAKRHGAPLVVMHLRGRPATMQSRPFVRSIRRSLSRGMSWSIRRALSLGVKRSQLIIDPGLGFGKTLAQNFEILAHLAFLRRFNLPVMVGASRKSFIRTAVFDREFATTHGRTRADAAKPRMQADVRRMHEAPCMALSTPSAALDFGDAAAAAAAVLAGAHIVRVHCVPAVVPAVRVADAILNSPKS
jgi:dihydropteroate synthase